MTKSALESSRDAQTEVRDGGAGETKPWRDRGRLAVLAIVLLAFGLRLYQLGANSLWYDETFSVYLSSLDIVSLTRHTAGDIHPPLYYYALHFWMALAGKGELALGFFSLIFGVLLVVAVYRIALRLFDRPVALVAALLVATSPFHLWYSQEVRMYTLATVLSLASLWFALAIIDDESEGRSRWRPWAGYVISSALGLYVLYYAGFALASLNLFVALWWVMGSKRPLRKAFMGKWLAAQLGVVVLYLPWLPTAIRQSVSPAVPPWRHFVDLGQVIKESWSALSIGQSSDPGMTWPFLLVFAGLYALGLLAALRWHGRSQALLLVAAVWGPVLLIFLVSLITPLFFVRYVFIYSPLFYATLSLGMVFAWRFAQPLGLLNLLVILGAFATSAQVYFHSDTYAPDDFRSAVRYIDNGWGQGDAVLVNAGYVYTAFLYYYPAEPIWRGRLTDYPQVSQPGEDRPVVLQTGSIDGDSRLGWDNPKSDFYPTTKEEVAKALEAVAERHQRLWVLRCYDTVTDPQGLVRAWLTENATLTDDIMVSGSSNVRVQRYLLGSGRGAKSAGLPVANFDNGIAIASFAPSSPSVKSGETAYLRFDWLREKGFDKDIRAYVSLVDDRGRIWYQQDNMPVGRLYPSSKWPVGATLADVWALKIPTGTPPGDYKLIAGAYVAAGGQALEVRGADGKPVGPQAVLGKLTVAANPDPAAPPNLAQVKADLGGGLGLADYKLGSRRMKPGESLHVDLFWKALATPQTSYTPRLILRDGKGQTVAQQEGPPVDGRYPTLSWHKGEIVRDQRDLNVDAGAPDGDFTLYVDVNGKDMPLGTVMIRGRPRNYEAPKDIANRLSARLGNSVELLGFDIEPSASTKDALAEVRAGETVRLTLYWRALQRMEISYTVFTQFLDEGGHIQGQRDRPPGDGTLPTSGWLAGEVIADSYEVQLKPDATGDLRLIVGLYDAKTGQRLAIADGEGRPLGDALVLGKAIVKPSSPQ